VELVNKNLRLGFIGFGEAAYEMSLGFSTVNIKNIFAYSRSHNDKKIREKAKKSNVILCADMNELAENCDIIISAVTSDSAIKVAKLISPYLTRRHIYVDINSVSSVTKNKIYEEIKKSGVNFIDAAVMGQIPSYRHKVPIIISGRSVEEFYNRMTVYGMNLTIIKGGVGSASKVKMIRSIFGKGLSVLLIETMIAANKAGVSELIYGNIKNTMEKLSFDKKMNRWVCGTVTHARRRIHEMEEVITTLKSLDVDPVMSKATKEVLSWIDSLNLQQEFNDQIPENYHAVIKKLVNKEF
jgi:3-hydroxyisobutyrate dehydrogenase-like beta-hydroxyacid dehydrogenase